MDKYLLAQAFAPSSQGEWRLRQGEVVSVQSDYTMTITIAGSSTEVTGVRSLSQPPPPGAGVWIMTNGTDLFVVGAIRAADRAIAPRAYRTTDQAINNASATPIIWNGENSDLYGFVSAGQSININIPGRYVAIGQVDFASASTGVRSASIIAGGSVVGAQRIGAYTGVAHLNVTSVPFTVSSTATVELWVEQDSSASLNVIASGNVSPGLSVLYI